MSARCESSSENASLRGSYAAVAGVNRVTSAINDQVNAVSENSLPTRP